MLEAGEAGVEQIDRAVQSAGYPMGPFALMDLVGIDVNLAVATALWEGFDEAVRFTPSPIQRALVAEGRLGRKTGAGFYRYEDGRSPDFHRPCLGWASRVAGDGVADDEIVRGSSWRSSTRPTTQPARQWRPHRISIVP